MSKNCLLKGTLIELEDDNKIEIEKLKVGEKLLSYSINGIENTQNFDILKNLKTETFDGDFSYQLIKNIFKNTFEQYYNINNKLFITEDHYIFCKRISGETIEYFWTMVENLKVNDYLFKSDNTFEKIVSIDIVKEEKTVYNIEVNSIYTFFANDYLVHNGAACSYTSCRTCYDL